MLNNGKELYKFLDGLLLPKGFVRKKHTYYYRTSECLCFLTIEKSDLGGSFGNVMGCFLIEINTETDEFPKYNKSHLKFNLQQFKEGDLIKQLFNFENHSFTGDQREQGIKDLIEKYAIPFLMDVSTKAGIKKAMAKYEDLIHWTKSATLEYLKIPLPK